MVCAATVGVAASVFSNLAIVTITITFGTVIINALPPNIKSILNYLLPALFGTLLANTAIKNPKLAYIGLPLAFVLTVGMRNLGMLNFLSSVTRNPIVLLVLCIWYRRFGSGSPVEEGSGVQSGSLRKGGEFIGNC